jgi:hypothetical protein
VAERSHSASADGCGQEDERLSGSQAGEMVIVNFDILPRWLLKDPAEFPVGVERLKGITLVVDEAHFLTNYKSQRSKKIAALGNLVSRVWFATGTPLTNNPGNLWSVLGAAGLAREAFGSWTNFKRLMGARKKSRWGGIEWGVPDSTVPERLRRVMLRRTRDEVLPDLPKKTYQDITVNGLSTGLRDRLDQAWADQGDYLEVEECLPDFEEFSKIRADLAAAKIPDMIEIIEQHEEQGIPLVVFSDHIAPVDAAGAREGWAVIKGGVKPEDRQAIVRAFQNGELKGVALTIGRRRRRAYAYPGMEGAICRSQLGPRQQRPGRGSNLPDWSDGRQVPDHPSCGRSSSRASHP